jgi:ADP-ribose pyrophosphatase YjhB (NUDIX family)
MEINNSDAVMREEICPTPRQRGTIIVPSPEGILLVLEKSGVFSLPGGALEIGEDPGVGACRELEEETGLRCVGEPLFLFTQPGRPYWFGAELFQNTHIVYQAIAQGEIKIDPEIRGIAYYNPGAYSLRMTHATQRILDRFEERWL